MSGAVISRKGSPAKQTVPSGTAQASPENRMPLQHGQEIGG